MSKPTLLPAAIWLLLLSSPIILASCSGNIESQILITSGKTSLAVDQDMYILLKHDGEGLQPIMEAFQAADFLVINSQPVQQFDFQSVSESTTNGFAGAGDHYILKGMNNATQIEKVVTYSVYASYPDVIFTEVQFINHSEDDHLINKWVSNHVSLKNTQDQPAYYAFQGSSTYNRADWVRKVDTFYYDQNFMGMNNSDYGGGIPVVDLWRRDVGIAVGHTELVPQEISLPTHLSNPQADGSVEISHEYNYPSWFYSGDTISSLEGFYLTHTGDYFNSLDLYSRFMQDKGIDIVPSEPQAFEPIWCAWGYERKFTKEEVIGTLDKVKELGIKWAVIDDGFQIAEGDWSLDLTRFPGGERDMKQMVDEIHKRDLKAKIWWTPLAADPGSKVLRDHPDAYLRTEEWTPQFITWWDSYYLSPVNEDAVAHTKETINMFLVDWGFDGFKMDGQHMNAVPADYGADNPLDAVEKLPAFFQMIYDEARAIKPHAVIENCPCGTCMSFYNMASANQTVSSDPESSWQIRHKGKTYKALIPHTAYYGDHVELSDNANDFASSMGIGAVLGTKFTYPADNPDASDSFLLTPEKEIVWKNWFGLYNEHMISKEKYLGDLYDIGYDKPETHVIKKSDSLYYAFYAPDWEGEIEFRGLNPELDYVIYDYELDRKVGMLKKGESRLSLMFKDHLLVVCTPVM